MSHVARLLVCVVVTALAVALPRSTEASTRPGADGAVAGRARSTIPRLKQRRVAGKVFSLGLRSKSGKSEIVSIVGAPKLTVRDGVLDVELPSIETGHQRGGVVYRTPTGLPSAAERAATAKAALSEAAFGRRVKVVSLGPTDDGKGEVFISVSRDARKRNRVEISLADGTLRGPARPYIRSI